MACKISSPGSNGVNGPLPYIRLLEDWFTLTDLDGCLCRLLPALHCIISRPVFFPAKPIALTKDLSGPR